jgi:hypothetical protein
MLTTPGAAGQVPVKPLAPAMGPLSGIWRAVLCGHSRLRPATVQVSRDALG